MLTNTTHRNRQDWEEAERVSFHDSQSHSNVDLQDLEESKRVSTLTLNLPPITESKESTIKSPKRCFDGISGNRELGDNTQFSEEGRDTSDQKLQVQKSTPLNSLAENDLADEFGKPQDNPKVQVDNAG